LKPHHDPSYADYMSPFAMALALMPISFFFLYLGSRLLGRLKYLSWRNVTLTFYGAISLSLLAILVGHGREFALARASGRRSQTGPGHAGRIEILSATKPPLTEHCNIQYGAGLWRCSCD
jgi:hypothetical protein